MVEASMSNGWAIRRNGTCLDVEVDCGTTRAPFHGCCPSGTVCPSQYNRACCPPGQNCTMALVATPHCANSSWTMFDNAGYFCCEQGNIGYAAVDTNSDGCLVAPAAPPSDISVLATVSQIVPSSIPTAISTSTTSSRTSSPSTTTVVLPVVSTSGLPVTGKSNSSALGTGAIVGIAVGAALGLSILMVLGCLVYRRRYRGLSGRTKRDEIQIHEMRGSEHQEMPVSGPMTIPNLKRRKYSELPAESMESTKHQ